MKANNARKYLYESDIHTRFKFSKLSNYHNRLLWKPRVS